MQPVKQFVGTGDIDRFMKRHEEAASTDDLLRAAWKEITLLVGDAKELSDANAILLETRRVNDAALSALRLPVEVADFDQYVTYFAKRDALEAETAYLEKAFNGNEIKLGKIAEEIARVLPMNTWFKCGDLAFSLDNVRETTYEASKIRWEIVIRKWGEHNAR